MGHTQTRGHKKGKVHSGVSVVLITKKSGLPGHKPVVGVRELIYHRGCDDLRLPIDTGDASLSGHWCHQSLEVAAGP